MSRQSTISLILAVCCFLTFLCFIPLSLYSQATFTNVTDSVGVADPNDGNGEGAAWGDFDNDGWLDLFVTNFEYNYPNLLFHNIQGDTFIEIAEDAGVDEQGSDYSKEGVCIGDYNNDGLLDIYIAKRYGSTGCPGTLFRNIGDLQFIDVTNSVGLNENHSARSAAWGDYDNDGDLDLYLFISSPERTDVLFRNDVSDSGVFTNVSSTAGITDHGDGRGGTWLDYNNDGWLDVYVVNESQDNILYKNNGNSTFDSVSANVEEPNRSLSAASGDYNFDMLLDIYVGGVNVTNILHRNNGDGTFTDVTDSAEVWGSQGGNTHTNEVAWVDFDNDMLLDLYMVDDRQNYNYLYKNLNGISFQETGQMSRYDNRDNGCAWGDYNNDGFLDVYITEFHTGFPRVAPNALYRNNGNSNHWLIVKLEGVLNNRDGIGARVIVYPGGFEANPLVPIMQEVNGGSGWSSHNSIPVEFGLKTNTTAGVVVEWPKIGDNPAIKDTLRNVAADQVITVRENSTNGQLIAVTTHGGGVGLLPLLPTLSIIDSDLFREVHTISYPYQSDPMGVAVSPDTNYLAVALGGEDKISVIDISDPNDIVELWQFSIDESDSISSRPLSVTMDAANRIFVSNSNTNLVRVFDLSGNPLDGGGIPVGSSPQFLDLNPNDSLLAVACKDADSVFVINVQTLAKVDSFPSSGQANPEPEDVVFYQPGAIPYLYVVNNGIDNIELYTIDGTCLDTVELESGSGPRRLGLNSNQTVGGMTNYDAGTVCYFKTSTNAVFKTIELGDDEDHPNPHPIGIANLKSALWGQDIYVADHEYHDLVWIWKLDMVDRLGLSSYKPYDVAVAVVNP